MDNVSMPIQNYFQGERVRLIAMEREHVPLVARWINDERISAFNASRFPVSREEQSEWYDRVRTDRTKRKLLMCQLDGQEVGMLSLSGIDTRNQRAEIGVYVVPEHQGKGYAKEGLRLVLRFAFLEMNLHKIAARILDFNRKSIELFESVGFSHEALCKEEVFTNGLYVDVHVLSLFRRDFLS